MSPRLGSRGVATHVLIADEPGLFRRGLREHLEASGLDVVGEAEDAASTMALSMRTQPQVILMDIRILGRSSTDAIRRLRVVAPGARVLLITDSLDGDEVVEHLLAGASGCLLKDADGDQIMSAIAAAAGGESALSPRIASALIDRVRAYEPPAHSSDVQPPNLTKREREVLTLITDGKDNNEIAAELVISTETVKTHVSTVLEKLGAGNRVQAAVKAVRAGLV
jgi:DNA-binding NarL/FixJ family response regulator